MCSIYSIHIHVYQDNRYGTFLLVKSVQMCVTLATLLEPLPHVNIREVLYAQGPSADLADSRHSRAAHCFRHDHRMSCCGPMRHGQRRIVQKSS